MKKDILISTLLVLFLVLAGQEILAQCPMCSMSASANLKEGGSTAKGLNVGIIFMLSMPYVLVAALSYILVKKFRNKESEN